MEGVLWRDCRLVRPLSQASSILQVGGMDTRSGRDAESEKALAKDQRWSLRATCPHSHPITWVLRFQLGEGSLTHPPAFCSCKWEEGVLLCLEAKGNSSAWEPQGVMGV